MYARLWRPIDDPPGAANYLAQWKYADADVLFESLDRAAQPLQDALHSIRANADLLLHSNDPVPTRPLDYVVNHVSIPHELNTFDTARGIKLPLTDVDVAQLQSLSEASALGVEGRGTVYDPTLRKSREIRADNDGPLRLSETLRSFDFPEARLRIQQALCATAVEVEYRPYKLVLYAPGDFFAAHGDMMSDASMFGSLALQIPITVGEGSIDEVGGALVFHPRTAHEASADLTTVLPTEPDGAVRLSYAAWLGDVQHEVREVKRARIVLLYRLFKRGHVPPCPPPSASSRVQLSLDAIFDCSEPNHLPVTATLPVFIYDCEDGEMPNPAPPGVFELDPTTYRSIISETTFPISCVGFMLQHHYPPAGLMPTELKGADAVLYEAVSATYTCHLVSVLEPWYKPYDDRYAEYFKHLDAEEARLASQIVKPVVVATSMEHWTTTQELNNHPIVLAAWVPGGGAMEEEGGGHLLGNCDGSTAWWYRSAALIVLPTRWRRCRWFFLAALKGDAPGLQRLYAVQDVFQHVLRFVS